MADHAEIIRLTVKERMTCTEVAAALGCSHGTVSVVRNKNGIVGKIKNRKDHVRPEKDVLAQDIKLGRKGIADKYGVALGTVTTWVNLYGLRFPSRRGKPIDARKVARLVKAGKSIDQIAGILKCSTNGLYCLCDRCGIQISRPSPHNTKRPTYKLLAAQCHLTADEIAEIYEVRAKTVRVWLAGYDLRCAPAAPTRTTKEAHLAEVARVPQVVAAVRLPSFRRRSQQKAHISASPRAIERALARIAQ